MIIRLCLSTLQLVLCVKVEQILVVVLAHRTSLANMLHRSPSQLLQRTVIAMVGEESLARLQAADNET